MSNLTFPNLVLRLVKGAELTFAEGDGNLAAIRSFCIALQNIIQTSLNSDGTLISGAVGVNGIPLFTDTGTANAYTITVPSTLTSYVNGQIYFISTTNASTGPSTLNVNGLGNIPIKVAGQPVSNQISASSVFIVVYLNGVFILVSGGGAGGSGGGTVVTEYAFSGQEIFNSPAFTLSGTIPASVAHGLGAVPTSLKSSIVCLSGDSGYTVGQTVPISEVTLSGGLAAFLFAYDTQRVYLQLLGAPYTINPSTQTSVAIDTTKWAVTFQAGIIQTFNQAVFPALQYSIAGPVGSFSFQSSLFMFQYGADSTFYSLSQLNSQNNQVVPLVSGSTSFLYVNGAVFGASFNPGIVPQFLFYTASGLYTFPAIDPNLNVIPPNSSYNGAGVGPALALVNGNTYTWTPATGDTNLVLSGGMTATYLASGGVQTIAITATGVTATLNGTASTVCNGTLSTTGLPWNPTALNTSYLNGYSTKPVWVTYSGSSIEFVYACSSSAADLGTVGAVNCFQLNVGTSVALKNTWASTNTAPLNLTSSSISNIAPFLDWHKTNSGAKITLFQYNPISKRIYVMTTDSNLIHIFQITAASNNFANWWNSITANREGALAYVKSIALGGIGSSLSQITNITVEFDQTTGNEICVTWMAGGYQASTTAVTTSVATAVAVLNSTGGPVFPDVAIALNAISNFCAAIQAGSGSVTRFPWIE